MLSAWAISKPSLLLLKEREDFKKGSCLDAVQDNPLSQQTSSSGVSLERSSQLALMTIDIPQRRRRRWEGSRKPYLSVPPPSHTVVCNSVLIAHGLGEELEDVGWEGLEKELHLYSCEGILIHAGCRPPSAAVVRSPRLLPITCQLLLCQ